MAKRIKTSDLSYEQVQDLKATLWSGPRVSFAEGPSPLAAGPEGGVAFAAAAASAVSGPTILAEGDSWFDYPPGLDLLDQLKLQYRYDIVSLAKAGDTIENMGFGTQYDRNFGRTDPSINVLIAQVGRIRPRVILLSGGGNDVAGEEFAGFLNHADSGLPPLRMAYVDEVIQGVIRRAFERIAAEIWKIDSGIAIVAHGYGYPIPDGRAVFNFPFGYRFLGPWLRPALVSKNITKVSDGKEILKTVIDKFNDMIAGLQSSLGGPFHHVDFRKTVRPGDWVNELHIDNETSARCAEKIHQVIKPLV
ncbi:hypothetical protein P12x_002312 [Tundrisphaera lichenicola]|uniref:hypothetical protein n=1 Tax=Tundrisphaera lichenicola TaxID=2029860 RepID=UPI003EBDB89C